MAGATGMTRGCFLSDPKGSRAASLYCCCLGSLVSCMALFQSWCAPGKHRAPCLCGAETWAHAALFHPRPQSVSQHQTIAFRQLPMCSHPPHRAARVKSQIEVSRGWVSYFQLCKSESGAILWHVRQHLRSLPMCIQCSC